MELNGSSCLALREYWFSSVVDFLEQRDMTVMPSSYRDEYMEDSHSKDTDFLQSFFTRASFLKECTKWRSVYHIFAAETRSRLGQEYRERGDPKDFGQLSGLIKPLWLKVRDDPNLFAAATARAKLVNRGKLGAPDHSTCPAGRRGPTTARGFYGEKRRTQLTHLSGHELTVEIHRRWRRHTEKRSRTYYRSMNLQYRRECGA